MGLGKSMKRELIPGKRLSLYICEDDEYQGKPLYKALTARLREAGISGVSVFRGIYGYGQHSHIHTFDIWSLSSRLPLLVQAVDRPEKIEEAAGLIEQMAPDAVYTLEPLEIRYGNEEKGNV
jgi:PII-like signaling protein